MRRNTGYSLVLFGSLIIQTLSSPDIFADSKLKIFSGIYTEQLAQPIFYDQFIPVVLHYRTPKFNKTELTFNNWYTCTTEKYPYSLSCPVVFHLNSAISNLHVDFETIQPGKTDEQSSHWTSHFQMLTQSSRFCTEITTHFPGLYTSDKDIEHYEASLKSCYEGAVIVEKNISDYVYSLRFPFSRMETNFYETFYKPVSQLSNNLTGQRLLASAVLSNSRTALQGSILGAFYAERNRWNFALGHCISKTLPPSLVTEEKLKAVLESVGNILENGTMELAIKSNGSIAKYFSLPLTDCTHTTNDLVVRLLVPVVSSRKNNSYELHRIQPVTFSFDEITNCRVKDLKFGSNYIYDPELKIAYETMCQDQDQICYLESHHGGVDLCVSSVLSEDLNGIMTYCKFECDIPTAPFSVMRVNREKIIFFEKHPFKAHISCRFENNTEVKFALEQKHRTYELELGCQCALELTTDNGDSVLRSFRPHLTSCSNESMVNISVLVPWHFVKNVDVGLGDTVKILEHYDLEKILRIGSNEINDDGILGASKRIHVTENYSSVGWSFATVLLVLVTLLLVGGQAYLYFQIRRLQVATGYNKDPVIFSRHGPALVENENDDRY